MTTIISFRREIFTFLITLTIFTTVWQTAYIHLIRRTGLPTFSIFDLELPKTPEALTKSLSSLERDDRRCMIIHNLDIDYLFMVGVYLSIAAWLLMIRKNTIRPIKILLTVLAFAQFLPWIFDINENDHLLNAIRDPEHELGMDFNLFKAMVHAKFIISITGACTAFVICTIKPWAGIKEIKS